MLWTRLRIVLVRNRMKRNNASQWTKKNSKYIFSNNKLTKTICATHLNNVWLLSYLGKKPCILTISNWHPHLTLTNLATGTLQDNCMECNQSHLGMDITYFLLTSSIARSFLCPIRCLLSSNIFWMCAGQWNTVLFNFRSSSDIKMLNTFRKCTHYKVKHKPWL